MKRVWEPPAPSRRNQPWAIGGALSLVIGKEACLNPSVPNYPGFYDSRTGPAHLLILAAFSIPQPAATSMPLRWRKVQGMPAARRVSWKARPLPLLCPS
jgi:hypothetical protein